MLLFALVVLLMVNSFSAQAADYYVYEDIDSSTTWASDNTYIINNTGELRIYNDAVLTIEENVTVLVEDGAWINVENGRINAVGTEALPILFTANDTVSYWAGIYLNDTADASKFYCVDFENSTMGLAVNGKLPDIQDGMLTFSNINGVAIDWNATSDPETSLRDLTFNNVLIGLRMVVDDDLTLTLTDIAIDHSMEGINLTASGDIALVLSNFEAYDCYEAFMANSSGDMDVSAQFVDITYCFGGMGLLANGTLTYEGSAISFEDNFFNADFESYDAYIDILNVTSNNSFVDLALFAENNGTFEIDDYQSNGSFTGSLIGAGNATIAISDVTMTNSSGDGLYLMGIYTIDVSLESTYFDGIDGTAIYLDGGELDVDILGMEVLDAGSGVIIGEAGNVTFAADGVVMIELNNIFDDAYGFYAEVNVTGTMDIVLCDILIQDVYSEEDSAAAIWFASDFDQAMTVDIADVYIDDVNGLYMPAGLFFFTDDASLDFDLTDVYVNDITGYDANAIYFAARDLPEFVALENITVNNTDGYGLRLYKIEGDFDILMNDFAANYNNYGVSFTTVFGAIDLTVNDTELMNNDAGLILIANGDIVIDMMESAFVGNTGTAIGATTIGTIEMVAIDSMMDDNGYVTMFMANNDITVDLDSVEMNENEYGIWAEVNLAGNVSIDVFDSEAVGNEYIVVFASAPGWVDVLVDNSSMLSLYSDAIYATSTEDEVNLVITDSVFDGSLYPGLTWYMAEEVDYEWNFIDDANYTMASSSREEVGLPFEFMFNGEVYDSIWMDADGYIAFDSHDVYSDLGSGDFIVPSYNPDYHYSNYARCGYDNTTDGYVTLWWFVYDDYNYLMDCFQVVIFENGDIQFNYADMESLYNNYEYGISNDDDVNTDLSGWISSPILADYRSVYLTQYVMAYGSVAYARADEFCTVIVNDSEFMNLAYGGIYTYTRDGGLDVCMVDSTFDKFGMYGGSAAFDGRTDNGTIDAYFVNNSFSYTSFRAINLMSEVYYSGEETLLVQDNYFYEVGKICARLATNVDAVGDFTLISTKEFIDNYGENVGYFGGRTIVDSDEGDVSLWMTDVFENNLFSGEPTYGSPSPDAPYGSFTSILNTYVDEGDLMVDRDVTIVNNTHSVPGDIYGISVVEAVTCMDGVADVDTVALITGNEIIDLDFDGGDGIYLEFREATTENGTFDVTRDIDVLDNTIVSPDDGMYMYFESYIDTMYESYNKVTGVVDFDYDLDLDIIGNEVIADDDGVYVEYYQELYTNLYDLNLDAAIDFSDNYVVCDYEGFYAYIYTEDFMDCYSSWGEEVTSTAVENVVIDVYGNEIYCDDDYGIDVESWFYGESNDNGAFVDLIHDVYFACSITDNYVACDEDAIYIYNWMGSYYSNQTSTGDFMYLIEGNVLEGDDEDGIYLDVGAESWVRSYEFNDVNDLDVVFDIDILSNVFSGFEYGIYAEIYAYSSYGLCDVDALVDVMISDNEFYDIEDEGIYLYYYYDVSQTSYSGPSAYFTSDAYMDMTTYIEISGNVFENEAEEPSALDGGDSTAIYIEGSIYNEAYMDLAVSILVDMNVISDFATGVVIEYVDAYEFTDIAITNNDFTDVGVGIVLDEIEATVTDNTFTGCYWAIYAEDAWVTIERTIVMDAMADVPSSMWGEVPEYSGGIAIIRCNVTIDDLYVENVGTGIELRHYGFATESLVDEYAVITNVEIVDCSERGIMLNQFDHLEISDASIVGCGYGMYLYYFEYVDISDVSIADCDYNGIYAYSGNYDEELAISDAIVTGSGSTGIYVGYVDFVCLTDVDVTLNDGDGAYLYGGEEVAVTDCMFFHNSGDGLDVNDYDYAVVTDIEASCNDDYGLDIYGDEAIVYNGVYTDNGRDGLYCGSYDLLWIVDASCELRNNDADFEGDLLVADGGELYMMNSDIDLDESDGCSIIVEEGGSLSFYNGYIGYYSDYGYNTFNVYGEMYLDNAIVNGFLKLYLGPTSDATLMDCMVVNNDFAGIFVDSCAPNVLNTLIAYCDEYGVYVYGETAEPTIMSSDILFNNVGLYAYQADLEYVVDNIIALNYMMGVFIEDGSGNLADNIVVLNNDNIYIKDSTVSIVYNEIGYGDVSDAVTRNTLKMVALAYQAVLDLLESVNVNINIDYFDDLSSGYEEAFLMLLNGQVGIHAINSEVICYGNQYALVETALLAEDSVVYFGDTVEKECISIPYFDANKDMKNVTVEAFVKDGVWAKDSILFMDGASIDVLDDAVMLFNSVAEIVDSDLSSVDFDLYAAAGSEATVIDTVMENAAVISDSTIDVWETKTIVVKDSDNSTVEGATVEIIDADGNVVANGTTDANGEFTAIIQVAAYSTDAFNGPEMPVEETYDYTVNVTLRNQQVSQSLDEMDEQTGIVLPGSDTTLSTETALIVAVLIAALLAVGLVAVAFRKD